jgi:biopolymer transport protein ExbD
MAFSFSNGGSPGRSRFRGVAAMSDINIVPFVDVVLVLLVIFMLTAHVMEFGLEVDVPKVRQVKDTAQELPVITVTKNGQIYLNEDPVNVNAIAATVRQKFRNPDSIYLRADKAAIWDVVVQVIGAMDEAKIKVNVVTQPEDEAERNRRR